MRAAVPRLYFALRTIAAVPIRTNNTPDQKSLGWRMAAMGRSSVDMILWSGAGPATRRRIASPPTKKAGAQGPPFPRSDACVASDAVLRAEVLEVLVEPLRLQALLQLRL